MGTRLGTSVAESVPTTLMAMLLFGFGSSFARADSTPKLTPPEPTVSVKAAYPQEALVERREGNVLILATVGKDGVVKRAEVAESSGDASLDQAATAAAREWHFRPALQDGAPIESQVRIPFHFHLAEHEQVGHTPVSPSPSPARTAIPKEVSPLPGNPSPLPNASAPTYESRVRGAKDPPSRGASDYHVDIEKLSLVPRSNASEFLKLAPGILLTNAGGEGHAEQVFLRGFDAREGQDIEFSVDGTPINESGNLHGNGYADTHFIIPELVDSLRIVEGPFDPRQGNYAVAGSADYHLGLRERGVTAKFSIGHFGSYRILLTWAPPAGSPGTFVGAELYQTNGFGQNRDGRRGNVMAQYEGRHGSIDLRVLATASLSSFHTAGVLRDDDYRAGRVGFYDTYDPRQGENASRYSLSAEFGARAGHLSIRNLVYGIARPLRLRENFTGFLLDVQESLQTPHVQRGDLLDLNVMEGTVGAQGAARLSGVIFKQVQEIELGYFARGDFVSASQQRVEAATGHPYHTDTNLDSRLGNIGLYADANLRFTRWLALRGGVRGDLFTYDVNDLCAVQSVAKPSRSNPPGDASCLDQQAFGAHREPNQRASTVSTAILPRASLIVGPLWGVGASLSAGQGVRSVDPQYITQDAKSPFASVTAYEGGVTFNRRLGEAVDLQLRSVVFYTHVDHDLIFSETAGRNLLGGGTTRLGSASTTRFTGPFWDLSANLTYVRATFDDSQLLVPYVPDLVFRADGALFGELPFWKQKLRGHPLRGALGLGFTYVGPRPLPYGARSDTIATLDANATIGWWFLDFSVSAQNLLDTQYRLGEFNYASDFRSQPYPALVPGRHFAAGAPRTVFFSIALNYGGAR
jgi:iron complex outermembrane receptor protein